MMHRGGTYFEEDKGGKLYDATIMKWLWSYIKPYRKLVLINFTLLLFLTGFRLSLPFIYKMGIDRYITPSAKEILEPEKIPGEYKTKGEIRAGDKTFMDFAGVKKRVRGRMKEKEFISTASYHLIKKDEEVRDIIERLKYLESEKYFIISPDELSKLSVIDRIKLRKGDLAGVRNLAILYLVLIFLIFILNYIQVYQIQYLGQRISFTVREDLIKKYSELTYNFFQKNPVGRLVTRVSNDVRALSDFFSQVLVYLGSHILTILGIMAIMIYLSPRLFLVILGILPLLIYLTFVFRKKAREIYRLVRKKLAVINATISESISGIPVIQAFVQEDRKEDEFAEVNNDYFKTAFRMVKVFAVFRPMISFIRYIGIAGLIWYGGRGIISGIVSFGTLVAFISYLERLFHPIRQLSEQYNIMQSAMAAGEKIYNVLDNDSKIPNPDTPVNPKVRGEIEFDDVWFSYEGDEWTLKNINFKIEPGEKVGIVGYTGSGKTTLIKLLLRLYDVDKGSIKLDGVDIRNMSKSHLRNNVATVFQEPFLFSGDIDKNVRLWREKDHHNMERALRISNLKKAMERRNIGLDFKVKEEGGGLSVGEKQLVTFARSLIGDSPVLVLDEATANIDPETEWLIQEALFKMIRDKTSLIIAHRLATLKKIDSLIVVHKGEIIQRGSHQELIEQEGIYRALYKLQEIA